jgi:hypothetical protein
MTDLQQLVISGGILTTLIIIAGVLLTWSWKRDNGELHKTK